MKTLHPVTSMPSEWHRTDTRRILNVDTGQPLAETMLEIKDLIWHSL
jgi:hypothetical protein